MPGEASGGNYSLTAFVGEQYPQAKQSASFEWTKEGPQIVWTPTLSP